MYSILERYEKLNKHCIKENESNDFYTSKEPPSHNIDSKNLSNVDLAAPHINILHVDHKQIVEK